LKVLRAHDLFSRIDDERFATLLKRIINEGIVEQRRSTVFLVGDESREV